MRGPVFTSKKAGFGLAAALAALALCATPVVLAAPAASTPVPAATTAQTAAPEVVNVDLGTQKILHPKLGVRRLAIGESKIADVSLVNGAELLVSGKALGVTSLIVWPRDPKAAPVEYRVQVGYNNAAAKKPELANAQVAPGVGISGQTPNLIAHRQAELSAVPPLQAGAAAGGDRAAHVIDSSEVALDTQVLSQIKVVEVNRTRLQQYGINFLHFGKNGVQGVTVPTSNNGFSSISRTASTLASATGFLPIASAFNFLYENDGFLGVLSVLEDKGLARTLAEPSLMAQSGQTASFLAGGEFPIPVPQGGNGTSSTVTIQFKEFGVRLNLTPTVLARNRIQLKVAPEVSELDYANGVSIQGFVVPGLIVRRTDTSVELGDGESFVISGLVSDTVKNNVNKVPWLGDLPYIGAFFRQTSISRSDKELIMVVTPHLVHPLRRDQPLPSLPGQAIAGYNPGFARTMFLEDGSFGQNDDSSGYSR